MKKTLLAILFTSISIIINAQITNIPDQSFEQKLIGLGYDDVVDGQVLTANIDNITFLDIQYNSIHDLTGIEDFIALDTLYCGYGQIEQMDISNNINLTYLNCYDNNILEFDVSNNINLKKLSCGNNALSNLDLNSNTALIFLYCGYLNLDSLDLSNLNNLEELACGNNNLTELDLSNQNNLTNLYCINNNLTELDLSNLNNLTSLYCENNNLTELDFSHQVNLESLNTSENNITYLDLSNSIYLTFIDVSSNNLFHLNVNNGNNLNIPNVSFFANSNPNLACIQVDNSTYSNTNWTNVDSTCAYSVDCSNITNVYIPDDAFEQELINLGYDLVLDDSVNVESINWIINLDLSSKSISDLTGINNFISLRTLNVYNNNLDSLNVSLLTELEELAFTENNIDSIDLTNNINLTRLDCNYNNLSDIDLSNNLNLTTVYFNFNQLSSIDISHNPLIEYFEADYNQIQEIDLSQNVNIIGLSVSNNILSSLSVDSNINLTHLIVSHNSIDSLDLSNNNLLKIVAVYMNNLNYLNIKNANNGIITTFSASENPDLSCIQVDDATYSETNWTNIDATSSFSEDCSTTNIRYLDLNNHIDIYPNPAKDYIHVIINKSQTKNQTVIISDITGKISQVTDIRQNTNFTIDVSNLTSGVYFIKIGAEVKKIFKQ